LSGVGVLLIVFIKLLAVLKSELFLFLALA
jgi:hypothetical protein